MLTVMRVGNLRRLLSQECGHQQLTLLLLLCLWPCQDIGESETHELEALFRPLLEELLQAVLAQADLSSQGIQLEGLDLNQLVRCTQHTQSCCSNALQLFQAGHCLSTGWALSSAKACLHGV